ncbi:hypothetical protein Ocepr_1678 [Oceanithermus profundus DSM 14977]|uniref:TolC family protein n=1 Tax=Oceanithermus profundus (strain DSM 14977 / NBRC 100410 / VKM B-2274 / 506) TaxID=670487 RepID=E4U4R4_OCEP5|nr:TolC family protein [Oceanithermus profundus]ADR37131.1 hypothetical protein Ocepr_1678 [Oceanithermus profundus DSM 14977]
MRHPTRLTAPLSLALAFVLVAAVALGGRARAAAPEDALGYLPPDHDLLVEQALLARIDYVAAQVGVSGQLKAKVQQGGVYTASGSLGWSYAPEQLLSRKQALENAERAVRRSLRRGVFDALAAYAELYKSYARLQLSQRLRDRARAAGEADTKAEIDHEEALVQFELAQQEAAAYGLQGPPAAAPVLFQLPEVPLEDVPDYRRDLYALQRARFKLRRLWAGFAPDLSVWAGVGNDGGRFQVSASSRGPSTQLVVKTPGSGNGSWEYGFELALTVPLDATAYTAVRRAQLELQQRSERFAQARSRVETKRERYRQSAAFAERRVRLALEELRSVEEKLAAARSGSGEASADELELQLYELQIRLADLWTGYLRKVYNYLDYVDAAWELQSPAR